MESDSSTGNVGQKIIRVFMVIILLSLGLVTFFISQSSNDQVKILVSQQRPARVVSLAKGDALIFAIRLEQWSKGALDRTVVETARTTLSEGLAATNLDGASPAKFASPEFVTAIKTADSILASSVPGPLPAELQKSVQKNLKPVTEQIIVQSSALVTSYEKYLYSSYKTRDNNLKFREQTALIILMLLLILLYIFDLLNVRARQANILRKEEIIKNESDELNLLIEKLTLSEAAVESLEELSKTKTAFVANMNHELRTPLGSIIGYVEIVKEMTDDKPELGIGNYLEVVDKNANLLLELVDDIFSLTKLDSNLAPLADVSVDISQVVEESITILQPDREKNNISVNFTSDTEASFFVQGDKGQLVQVVVNLLSNAIKFSKANSQIDIDVAEVKHGGNFDSISIAVRDHGIGIPATEISKLFTRFYRAKNAKDKQYPGTGLGLSIVEQIVHMHGGTIRVESEEGKGTTFTVELPKNLSPAEELVLNRRHAVLERAINELAEASKSDLPKVSHSLSGLIGFYTFEEESRMIRDFSNWLNLGSVIDPITLETRRQSLLSALKLKLATLPPKDVQ